MYRAPCVFTDLKKISEWKERYVALLPNNHLTVLVKNPILNHTVPIALTILLTQDETTEKNHKASVSLQLCSVFVFFTFHFVGFFRLLGYQETIFFKKPENIFIIRKFISY